MRLNEFFWNLYNVHSTQFGEVFLLEYGRTGNLMRWRALLLFRPAGVETGAVQPFKWQLFRSHCCAFSGVFSTPAHASITWQHEWASAHCSMASPQPAHFALHSTQKKQCRNQLQYFKQYRANLAPSPPFTVGIMLHKIAAFLSRHGEGADYRR